MTAEISNYNNADRTLAPQKEEKQATQTAKQLATSSIIHTFVRPDLGIFKTVQLDYIKQQK